MAPAAAACSSMAQKKSQPQEAATEAAFGARMATLLPLKGLSRAKSTLTLDFASFDVDVEGLAVAEDLRCETPKSSEHRVPDVDVDFCPPAPKKARGHGRFALICAIESENSTLRQDLESSRGYLL